MNRLGKMVWLLGLTQVIGYGTLYYSFAILADDIAESFGWTQATFFAAFSAALVAGGLTAPHMGKALDHLGAARIMMWGSVAAALAMALLAVAPAPAWFVAALVVSQIAGTFVLYEAAFTSLVQATGGHAQRRIVHLTLIAGFASSVFWPLTQWLDVQVGWRMVFAIYALLNLLVCLPVHRLVAGWAGAARIIAHDAATKEPKPVAHGPLKDGHRRTAFLLVTLGFSLSSFALSAVLAQMVPMLIALGFGTASLGVAVLFGPAQVAVRFTNLVFGSRRHPLSVTIIGMALLPLALFTVAATAPAQGGAVAFVILVGLCSGLKSIVQGTLTLALFGPHGFGARIGLMASFRYLLGALAPFVFAWVAEHSTVTTAAVLLGAIGCLGVMAFLAVGRLLWGRGSS
jgi:MFS family permease